MVSFIAIRRMMLKFYCLLRTSKMGIQKDWQHARLHFRDNELTLLDIILALFPVINERQILKMDTCRQELL